jgi:hypothetical protein
MGKKSILVLLMAVSFCFVSWSQEVAGGLEGRAVDPQGIPLADVDIIIQGDQMIGVRTTQSDAQGYFRAFALPAGFYQIKFVHMAYRELIIEDVTVRLGKTTALGEIKLPDKVQETFEVVVTASAPLIDPVSTAIGGNLSPQQFESLPVDRNTNSLAELLPHSNNSYYGDETNIAGSTGLENKYFIDGTDVTDPFRGLTGVNLPYNFVREVEVRSGGYQAEFGSSLGGILNVITYSGGNEFNGQVFGFFANNRFTAEPRQSALEPSRGDFSMYDFGLSLGGPVIKDKLWFYGAYNPDFEREEVEIPGLDLYEDKTTIHRFAGKLTWQLNPQNNLVFSVLGDPSYRNGVGETFISIGTPKGLLNPDPYLEKIQQGGVYFSLRGTHILNSRLFLETMISRGRSKEKNVPLTNRGRDEIAFIDNMTGFWSGGSFSAIDVNSCRTMALAKGTLNLSQHILKAGVEFKDNTLEGYVEGKFLSRYSPFSYLEYYTLVDSKVRNRTLAAFFQDSWRIHPRLRLNLGLRWEGQYLYGSDGELAQSIGDQFQPRLGFVFLTKSDGSQRLFGSAGRFYHDISTWFSLQHTVEGTIFESKYYDHDPRIDPTGGQTFVQVGDKSPRVDGLIGQHFDEFTLGYELEMFSFLRFGVRGIYRVLREGIEDAEDPVTQRIIYGNPGRGTLKDYPAVKRDYIALELTVYKVGTGPFNFFASYVLSRNEGNYPGLFNADRNQKRPNADLFFNKLDAILNYLPQFEGLLPNDRTHVFKLSSWYNFDFGLSAGAFIIWQSGTPLNEFGGLYLVQPWQILLVPRGSAGRTPGIFDLSLRFTYNFSRLLPQLKSTRLILDIFHLGSSRTPVNYEQVHYFNRDMAGNQINPNPNYGLASRYYPPTSVRLGFEIGF